MTQVNEIGPDIYRISTYSPQANLLFCQFLVLDDEPLLFHTGMRRLFPQVRGAVASLIDPSKIRWIGLSHFEADECGSLDLWQELAPHADAVCSFVAKIVSIDDSAAVRPAKGMADGELLSTGKHRFRFIQTPHVPHCWEAGHLFEETTATLFCSDLFQQNGDVEPLTTSDVIGRFRQMLIDHEKGPLAGYLPFTSQTERLLQKIAFFKPKTIATMHGSTFVGDGERALVDLALAMKEILSTPS